MIIISFVAGGAFFILLDRVLEVAHARFGALQGHTGPWAIFTGVAMDLFNHGIMSGTGSTRSFGLGSRLDLGQVPADIPEGFATIASFNHRRVTRRIRLPLSGASSLPEIFKRMLPAFRFD